MAFCSESQRQGGSFPFEIFRGFTGMTGVSQYVLGSTTAPAGQNAKDGRICRKGFFFSGFGTYNLRVRLYQKRNKDLEQLERLMN
jgi:hypothetical protein